MNFPSNVIGSLNSIDLSNVIFFPLNCVKLEFLIRALILFSKVWMILPRNMILIVEQINIHSLDLSLHHSQDQQCHQDMVVEQTTDRDFHFEYCLHICHDPLVVIDLNDRKCVLNPHVVFIKASMRLFISFVIISDYSTQIFQKDNEYITRDTN